jgi:hypothetical protein
MKPGTRRNAGSGFFHVRARRPHVRPARTGTTIQLKRGDAIHADSARGLWRANAQSIALFGFMLAVALIFWERVAAIVFAMFYRGEPLQVSNLLTSLVFSGAHIPWCSRWAPPGG